MEFPGERLVIRLWGTITEKGIASLVRPWQMRREGRALIELRREEIVALAQAERDAEDIRAGRKRLDEGGRLLALPAPGELTAAVDDARAERPALQAATRIASDNLAHVSLIEQGHDV